MSETETTRLVTEMKKHIGLKEVIHGFRWLLVGVVGCTAAIVGFIYEVKGNIRELSQVTLRTQQVLDSVMTEHRDMDRRLERHEALIGTILKN